MISSHSKPESSTVGEASTDLSSRLDALDISNDSRTATPTGSLYDEDDYEFSDDETTVSIADTSVLESGSELDKDEAEAALREAKGMLNRCKYLLKELELFNSELRSQGKEATVESRTFRNELRAEGKYLKKVGGIVL